MTLLAQPNTGTADSYNAPAQLAPFWIRTFAVVAVLAAVAVAVVLAVTSRAVRDGLTVIGHRTAPQVTATEDLYFALADMDAQLANVLLAGDDPTLAELRTSALDTYEKDRTRAGADLQQATTVAGDDATAQDTVRDVLDQFGHYQSLAGQTIQLNDREGNDAGRPSEDVLSLQRQATAVLHAALDTTRKLTDANGTLLDQSYQDKRAVTVTACSWLAIFGGLLLASLAGLQVVLRLRMRRRLNPALLIATLLTGWLTVGGIALMTRESEHLRTAKEDAFNSLMVLRQARAVSYDANADESRFLLDPGRADEYEKAFFDKSNLLADVGAQDISEYDARLRVLMNVYHADNSDMRIDGYFGAELNNITFTGERAAAEKTVVAYQLYQNDDRVIRQMVADGDLRKAIEFCADNSPGTSNYYFYQYDKALTNLIEVNQHAFDTSVAAGESALDGWTGLIPYGAGFLIVALVAIGIWPRLAEYR